MYRITFSGELLDGFQMQDVQKAAAIRLRLGEAQLQRLFSGETTVLKKAVSAEASQPYLAELARMGMKARLEALAPLSDAQSSEVTFKVVFWGKTIAGFSKAQVMRAVPKRLRVDDAQVVRLFSGGKAVLKRGVSAPVGARYVTELARIGMQVELEIETDSLPVRNATASQVFAYNSAAGGVVSAPLVDEDNYGSFLQTQVDLQRNGTLLGTDIMGALAAQEAQGAPSEPPAAPPPKPAPTPAETKAKTTERLASAIELAYAAELGDEPADKTRSEPKARCPACGHRQSKGDRCDACGCELTQKTPKGAKADKAAKAEKSPKTKKSSLNAVRSEDMTRSLRDELSGSFDNGDLATLMREMRRQTPQNEPARRKVNPVPVLIGGACVLAVGGWLLFSH